MSVLLPRATFLFASMLIQQVSATGCPDGRFGVDCKLPCRCITSPRCGRERGDCPNNESCSPGFFGPGCQYEDRAYNHHIPGNLLYLIDNNPATCNPAPDARRVFLFFMQKVEFTWIRIRVNNEKTLFGFTVRLNNSPCQNERKFVVDATTVDVTCDKAPLLAELMIEGNIAPSICSIHVTAGRNVALFQHAEQSSNQDAHFNASNAVDGNKNQCASTAAETYPSWKLNLIGPHYVRKAIVYNTIVTNMLHLLHGFTFQASDSAGRLTFIYTEPFNQSASKYEIDLPMCLVQTVEIIPSERRPTNRTTLTLCEVELIGETLCPEGTYGLECDQTCTCTETSICNTVNGVCAQGCAGNKFGLNCSSDCSVNCYLETCSYRTGQCVHCQAGYYGHTCDTECEAGTYGQDCVYNCSENCFDICDTITGRCTCKAPYVGLRCTECRMGQFGPNCTGRCPPSCADGKCHIVTGECIKCAGMRRGTFCDECPNGFYGRTCNRQCSPHCYNGTCGINSGNCSICLGAYSGPQCLDVDHGLDWFWVVLPVLAIFGILFSVCLSLLLMLWRRYSSDRDGGEGASGSTETHGPTTVISSPESTVVSKAKPLLPASQFWQNLMKRQEVKDSNTEAGGTSVDSQKFSTVVPSQTTVDTHVTARTDDDQRTTRTDDDHLTIASDVVE